MYVPYRELKCLLMAYNTTMTRKHPLLITLAATLLFSPALPASPPSPFVATYDANYQGIRAQAEMQLQQESETGYEFSSSIRLRMLGVRITSIDELSRFEWQDGQVRPQHYSFRQRGVGSRSRSVDFDWENRQAHAKRNDDSFNYILRGEVHDELSMYIGIQQALADDVTDIYLNVIERGELEEQHFRVLGEEMVSTPLGSFNAVKLEKVRDYSSRETLIWLASDWEYILLRLYQRDPNGDEYNISINNAIMNGEPVRPLP